MSELPASPPAPEGEPGTPALPPPPRTPFRWRRRHTFRLLLLAAALGITAACFFFAYRAAKRVPSVRPWVERFEARLFGSAAPKLLTDDMRRTIELDPTRGRRARAIKIYRKLDERLKLAAAEGHDAASGRLKLKDAAILINRGDYAAAEELMSKLDFFMPEWRLQPPEEDGAEEPAAP